MSNSSSSWREHVRVFLDAGAIADRVRALGGEISRDLAGSEPMVIGILKGSVVFFADLVRHIDLPLTCDFIGISSYGSASETSGVVQITRDLDRSVEGKPVLIVEDIIDTGLTMQYLLENLRTRRPASIRIAALLRKPARARVEVAIDYLGFDVPDEFVVGYGLDFAGRFRNLPFVGIYHGPR